MQESYHSQKDSLKYKILEEIEKKRALKRKEEPKREVLLAQREKKNIIENLADSF